MRISSPKSRAQLVSHPDRLRIISALAGRRLTPKEIGEAVPGIAQATLYRQLALLLDGGILEVVEKRQAHGAVESTYALKQGASHLSREEFASLNAEEHEQTFAILAGEIGLAMSNYLSQPGFNPTNEGMTYFGAKLTLTDEQARKLRLDLLELLNSYAGASTEDGSTRRILIASIPSPKS